MRQGEPAHPGHKGPSGEIVESAREARQGYRDSPVFFVVTIATGLAFVALLLLWLFYF